MTPRALELVLVAGAALVTLGLAGMMLRRSVLVVVMSGTLSILGLAVVIVSASVARGNPSGVALAMLLVLFACTWALAGAAVALAAYRRRGTENIDELRELRG